MWAGEWHLTESVLDMDVNTAMQAALAMKRLDRFTFSEKQITTFQSHYERLRVEHDKYYSAS